MAQVSSSPTLSHSRLAANLSSLPNRALLDETKRLAANERSSKADLIIALREVDSRRLYLAEGHSCMYYYCTRTLLLSEQAAYSRIEVARVSRVFPQVLEALVRGALSLTTAVLIAPHLTSANVEEWLSAASFKSKREVDRLIAARHPKPNVPTVIRRQSQPPVRSADQADNRESAPAPAAQAPAPTHADDGCEAIPTPLLLETPREVVDRAVPVPLKPAVMAPLSATTYKIQFTADQETHDKLRHAQALLRHQIPNGDMGAVINKALTLLIADLERKKFGIVRRPRGGMDAKDAVHAGSRTIPAAVRRAVAARDGGRCAFVGRDGRCEERGFLEFHHIVPYAAGGKATVDNIALRCRAHNGHEAVLYFGEEALPHRSRADPG